VLRSFSILCSSPISIKNLPNRPASVPSPAGIVIPHCSMYWTSATVLRQTDFPPALGPEIRSILSLLLMVIVSGTTSRPAVRAKESVSSGWRTLIHLMCGASATEGMMQLSLLPKMAFALIKSISARKLQFSSSSSMYGLMVSARAVRIRTISRFSSCSSSVISLFSSTTSEGSMNTVFPVADSS